MGLYEKVLAAALCCVLMLCHLSASAAFSIERTRRDAASNPLLTLDVLEGLVENIKDQIYENQQKRRYDAGYGGRFGVAHSVGSKLMALKNAADWNGPGK